MAGYDDDPQGYQVFDLGNEAEYEDWLILRHLKKWWCRVGELKIPPATVYALAVRAYWIARSTPLWKRGERLQTGYDKWYDVHDAWWSEWLNWHESIAEFDRLCHQDDMKGRYKHAPGGNH